MENLKLIEKSIFNFFFDMDYLTSQIVNHWFSIHDYKKLA